MSAILFDAPGPRARRRHLLMGIATVLGIIAVFGAVIWKLWSEDQFTAEKWEPFVTPNIVELLLEGLVSTLQAALIAIIGAVIFGLVFGAAKLSDHRVIRWPAWLVVEFFRAVPLLLLIIFIWAFQGSQAGVIMPLVLGLILYNGSVLAEVFRAGINAVPPGQAEAAYALGMRKSQVMTIVLIPQAVKIMLPAIISQCIVALKDTSLGYAIVAPGLTGAGREIWRTFENRLATALVLAAIYILLNLTLSWLAEKAQKRIGTKRIELVGGIVQGQPGGTSSNMGAL
ncbi:amino acid ABC transporter permease [Aeromicrobium sp.]|uniref:amino acid ABC transporter permease n=1 Tax=Aeromicrobium sp. TaxID=1871063 RepID=UPI002FC58C42